ncbi:MAG: methyltransferase [Planctomycetota bacterium]
MPEPRPAPLTDDTPIYDIYIANRASAALAVAVRLRLFERLEARPLDSDQIAQELELQPRPTRALVIALESLGLLERDVKERYRPTARAAAFLVPDREPYLGWLIDLDFEHFITPERLMTAMKHNREQAYGDQAVWESHEADPAQAERFAKAMHSISLRPASALAEAFDFGAARSLLDVGGGQGTISQVLLERHPDLRATVFELATVCRLIEASSTRPDRLSAVAGDMFEDEWPTGHDLVLLSQILHDWSPDDGARLLEKAWNALPSGGSVLIHEKLVADDQKGPVANALVSLDMLFWTEGQQYTAAELATILDAAGFDSVTVRPTCGYWSLVSARKP